MDTASALAVVDDLDCCNDAIINAELKNCPELQNCVTVVLADYSAQFYPSGIRLSALQQCHLDDLFDTDICKGHYRKKVHVSLSDEDKATFENPVFCGADTYGEIRPESFLEILWKLGARPGERFYDLGSGTGKLVAIAWLLGLRSTGIELSRARSERAFQTLARLENRFEEGGGDFKAAPNFLKAQTGGLDFICGSIFDVDFTDADIVLFSSVMFGDCSVSRIASTARWMKPGSRIISYHDLCECSPEFKLLGEVKVATTWNADSAWFVHEVVKNPPEAERGAPGLMRSYIESNM